MTARALHHTTRVREHTVMILRLCLLVACAAVPAAAQTVPVVHKAPKSAASVRSAGRSTAAAPRLVVAPKVQPALRSAAAPGTITVVAPTLGARPAKAAIASAPPRLDLTGAKRPKAGARQ
jgi:hypothetical protein